MSAISTFVNLVDPITYRWTPGSQHYSSSSDSSASSLDESDSSASSLDESDSSASESESSSSSSDSSSSNSSDSSGGSSNSSSDSSSSSEEEFEYYLELVTGGDPGLDEPIGVKKDGSAMTLATVGSLFNGQYGWGDNDSLGYDTIYIKLAAGIDPDTLVYGAIQAELSTSYIPSIEAGNRNANKFRSVPVDATTLSATTWTEVADENYDRDVLAFINQSGDTAWFSATTSAPSSTDNSFPVVDGGIIFWDINDIPTCKIWAYSTAGGVVAVGENSNS